MSWKKTAIQSIKKYDENIAMKAALYSQQIYDNVSNQQSISHSKLNSVLFMDIIMDHNTVYAVFRGTKNISNILTNVNIRLVNIDDNVKVHSGFYKRYQQISEVLFSSLAHLKKKSIVCCGHSMGAAIATIAAYNLAQSKYKVKLYTFGSPQVGNIYFKAKMAKLVPLSWRFVNSNDVVVRSIPRSDVYHIGILMMIKPVDDTSVEAHRMKAYLEGIESKKYDMSRYTICKSKQ
jgi:predicted lipase